jgi:hypothetical protein
MVVVFGALTAGVALMSAQGILSASEVGFVPGMMVAFGVAELIKAERVRSWERERNSELLVTTSWVRWRARGYFVRPH